MLELAIDEVTPGTRCVETELDGSQVAIQASTMAMSLALTLTDSSGDPRPKRALHIASSSAAGVGGAKGAGVATDLNPHRL